jgi:hypothetical protein
MKFVIAIVSLAFAATVAAVPTNIDAGAPPLENRAVSLSSTGFQDYIIPAGPTGVDLAGGFQEIPGQGVCLSSAQLCLIVAASLANACSPSFDIRTRTPLLKASRPVLLYQTASL